MDSDLSPLVIDLPKCDEIRLRQWVTSLSRFTDYLVTTPERVASFQGEFKHVETNELKTKDFPVSFGVPVGTALLTVDVEERPSDDPSVYTGMKWQGHRLWVHSKLLESADITWINDPLIHLVIMVKNADMQWAETLQANKPAIDQWTILDTGSTDDTVATAERVLSYLPGKVIHMDGLPDFSTGRNYLLDEAEKTNFCAFTIMLDDTHRLREIPKLREFLHACRADTFAESFSLYIDDGKSSHSSNRVLQASKPPLRYLYRIHETLPKNKTVIIPERYGYIYNYAEPYFDNRSATRNKEKDLAWVNMDLEDRPDHPRSVYYKAQTLKNMGRMEEAAEWYQKRFQLEDHGYEEERYDAMFIYAEIHQLHLKDFTPEQLIGAYMNCMIYDPERSDPLIHLGVYFQQMNQPSMAMMFLTRALQIGSPPPPRSMSIRYHLYEDVLPRLLIPLCVKYEQPSLGLQACRLFPKPDQETAAYMSFFTVMQQLKESPEDRKERLEAISDEVDLWQVMPYGWAPWSGQTLEEKGLGGSETFAIDLARRCAPSIVFCETPGGETFEDQGVIYVDLGKFMQACRVGPRPKLCVIHRRSDLTMIPTSFDIPTRLMLHDMPGSTMIYSPKVDRILVLSKFHRSALLQVQTTVDPKKVVVQPYSIRMQGYTKRYNTKLRRWIFPSFPNRGLLYALRLFARLSPSYGDLRMDICCDMTHPYVIKNTTEEERREITAIMELHRRQVTNHGWVNPSQLQELWNQADVWVYPCVFLETFCRVGLEAGASMTLAVTNGVGALSDVPGVVVPGDPRQPSWLDMAEARMRSLMDPAVANPESWVPLIKANRERAEKRDVMPEYITSD